MAALGVGTLEIVDDDKVELSNLNRQILHWERDIGKAKIVSASDKLQQFNPSLKINSIEARFTAETAKQLIPQYDIVNAFIQVCSPIRKPLRVL